MKFISALYFATFFICLLSCTNEQPEITRPKDVWAFRSVLDRKPRMLTLALDTACYVAYDLANCTIYKAWKGGVDLQGAAYTDKKNVQPITWGTSYSDSLHNTWRVERNGVADSFRIQNKGYRFANNQVYIKYVLITSGGDSITIEERPEFRKDENGNPVLERSFTTSRFDENLQIALASPGRAFLLKSNGASVLTAVFKSLPPQQYKEEAGEYDHRGRYYIEKSDCFTCHEMEQHTVGPSFHQIASRYKLQEGATQSLIAKVKNGGSGVWGTAAMNPHPQHSETEIRTMLDYILTLDPAPSKSPLSSAPKKVDTTATPGFGAPLNAIHPSYDVQTIHKWNFKPRVGGLAFTTAGDLLVSTWDSIGAVYLMKGVETGDTNKITVRRIATGLAEPLGIEVVDGVIYVLQKQELTKLVDNNNDELIDEYEVVCNSWEVTGDFHEFAFGLVHRDGYFYATLSMAMRLMSHEKQKRDRGKTIKIAKDGTYEWINYGLRTPNGIGLGPDDEIFVTDNQGEWVPANKLVHVKRGEYHGMRWGHLDSGKAVPAVALPAVWLPEDEIGNSPSEPVLVEEGMYKGQMLHGDVTYGGIQRDFLEKVDGEYQGAVFRFTQGLEAGVNRMRFGKDGALYIGGVGMVGGWSWKEKQFGLQRMKYNGKPVFDILAIRIKSNGFELEFTEPVSKSINLAPNDIVLSQWWYLPTADYGGPKKDLEQLHITAMSYSSDRKKLLLTVPGLKEKHVVYFRLPKIRSEGGRDLWSGEAWYTLNNRVE